MCQTTFTMSFCLCPGGNSYAGDPSFTPPGGCQCPDPCEELVLVDTTPDDYVSNCSCASPNGAVSVGALQVNQIVTTYRCDPKDPLPPECTTTTTTSSTTNPPPPPDSSCTGGGGGN